MPNVFACFLAALIPDLVQVDHQTRPQEVDLQYANAAERQLAAEQNRRAGWEDWFGEKAEPRRPTMSAVA